MERLKIIQEEFWGLLNDYLDRKNAIERKVALHRAQMERLKIKEKKLSRVHPRWTEDLLRPVVTEIHKHIPGWQLDDDTRLSPMGLGCRVSVFFYRNLDLPAPEKYEDHNSIYIVFLPGELSKGELFYETGEQTKRYQKDTIGAINGFNQVTKKLESIEEAVQHLQKQIKTNYETEN